MADTRNTSERTTLETALIVIGLAVCLAVAVTIAVVDNLGALR